MRTRTLIGAGLALALAAGVGAYSYTAVAQGGPGYGPGWMMGGGYGPGHMRGPGGGQGAGQWNCPTFGQNDEQGSGTAGRQGEGYGPGYHMRGGYGPGMMGSNGYGPGMMQGYGPGYDRRGDVQGNQTLNLSTDDVKGRMERWLNWRGNARLKVGEVKEKDADTITADVVTKDNSLVQRFIIDRHTGVYREDNS